MESHIFPKHLLKMQIVSQNLKPEKLFELPQVRESISGPASHHWRPRAIFVLGIHRGAFRKQKLRSIDVAVVCQSVERRLASGGFPGRDSEDADGPGNDESCAQLSSTGSTDKRTMNVSGLNIFKTVQNKKHSQTITNTLNKFQYILFPANCLQHPSTKRCL